VSWELVSNDVVRLAELVTERSGLAFPESRWPFLRNRAREVMVRSRFTSARRWLEEVELSAAGRGALYCELEDALQVHETSFFRYEEHHRLLTERVLPALLRTGGPRVRMVSVGCATGEEPYSLAITVREHAGRLAGSAVEILGLDASRPALVRAVNGVYPEEKLDAVPPAHREKYFVRTPEGFAVGSSLRQMVRFRHHDLRRGLYIGTQDVIVCCNVLPYFTGTVRREMTARLVESLRPGGFLFLGHAESVEAAPGLLEPMPAAGVHRRVADVRSPALAPLGGEAVPGG
jgi:chemotaxis protein methyltransferase CheR